MMRAKTEEKVKRWKEQRWLIDSVLVGIMTADITQTTGGASATPLPATWAMMLGGLVFLGWMARRRKTSNKDARGWDLATA